MPPKNTCLSLPYAEAFLNNLPKASRVKKNSAEHQSTFNNSHDRNFRIDENESFLMY